MNEEVQKFDGHPADETTSHEEFSGPSGYGETNYSFNGAPVANEDLKELSPDVETYALTEGFPVTERLENLGTPDEYVQFTAELGTFYGAQIEALENGAPATTADMELVEFAQAVQGSVAGEGVSAGQPSLEITTSAEAVEYFQKPGFLEKLSANGALRRALLAMFSATSLAAVMPASAQGGVNFGQLGTYVIQRGVQEGQAEVQARAQLENMKQRCDFRVQSLGNDAEVQIANNSNAIRGQIENIAIHANISAQGVDLLASNALEQFRVRNPQATPQQLGAFTQMRQLALNGNLWIQQMKRSTESQINQEIRSCDIQMRELSAAMSSNRTARGIGDVGNVFLMQRR